MSSVLFFFFNDTRTTEIYTYCHTLSLHDALPICEAKANELFDLIDKFAGYGFNKSHAAAYALVAYHTAWLKAHHPVEFFAASMAYDIALTDKLSVFVDDKIGRAHV